MLLPAFRRKLPPSAMPNHVHLIVTPADADGLRATLSEAHRRYAGTINARFRWTGHLFQGCFGAVVMDEPHLLAAARYIALNPVVRAPHFGAWPAPRGGNQSGVIIGHDLPRNRSRFLIVDNRRKIDVQIGGSTCRSSAAQRQGRSIR